MHRKEGVKEHVDVRGYSLQGTSFWLKNMTRFMSGSKHLDTEQSSSKGRQPWRDLRKRSNRRDGEIQKKWWIKEPKRDGLEGKGWCVQVC